MKNEKKKTISLDKIRLNNKLYYSSFPFGDEIWNIMKNGFFLLFSEILNKNLFETFQLLKKNSFYKNSIFLKTFNWIQLLFWNFNQISLKNYVFKNFNNFVSSSGWLLKKII